MKNSKVFKMLSISLGVCFLSFSLLQTPADAAGDAKAGKKIFETNCATCHGKTGKGDGPVAAALNPKPKNFTDGKFKYGSKDAEIAKFIKVGKAPMPPWGGILSPKDIDNVVAYIRTLKKK